MTYHGLRCGLAGNDRSRGGYGGARWGEALGRWVCATGQGGVCGHCRSTLRRELFHCLTEAKTKLCGAVARPDAARELLGGAKSLCRERLFAKDFIGRGAG